MRYFVHLKDNVVFAWHQSEKEEDIPGDNIILVESDPESYLLKKYENGNFVNATELKYAVLDSSNTVVSIEKTYFTSDIKDGNVLIDNDNVAVLWKWNGSSFVSPDTVLPVEVIAATPADPIEAVDVDAVNSQAQQEALSQLIEE